MPEQEITVQHAAGQDEWVEEPIDELPRRPRRRLLGAGGNPIPLALLGVLLIACGFIAGVLVEKSQSASSSSSGAAAGLASRFAALRGGASGAGSSTTGSSGASGFGSGGGATTGSVAYLSGDTLYVTNPEGNTVKVTTSAASTVTKTVRSNVKSLHPGETVLVTGITGARGVLSAESIRVDTTGGLGGLFAGAGGSGRSNKGSGEQTLFGSRG
jgi:hypothetical protein